MIHLPLGMKPPKGGKNGWPGPPGSTKSRKGAPMGRIIKALIFLILVGVIGISVYAYLGDLAPEQGEVVKPVVLNAD